MKQGLIWSAYRTLFVSERRSFQICVRRTDTAEGILWFY